MPKKNGFMMYVDSRRAEFLAAGHPLDGGLRDLVALCATDWTELSEEQKTQFQEKAKSFNERAKMQQESRPPQQKRNRKSAEDPDVSGGSSSTKNVAECPSKLDDLDTMLNNRQLLLKQFTEGKGDWLEQPIVICSFTLYAEPGYGMVYLPAEIGLTAMSLKHGVVDNFARVIDPGKIPLGYGIEAIQMARQLGLPDPGTVPEFRNLETIMINLENFLQQYKGNLPGKDLYVFAFDTDFLLVRRCLEWLFAQTDYRLPVQILSIDQFCYLASSYGRAASAENKDASVESFKKRVPGKSLIGSFIYASTNPTCELGIFMTESDVERCIRDVDNYKYFEELCCIYHVKSGKEIQNCALNLSNRYAYSMLEILTISNPVRIIKGRHFPQVSQPAKEKRRRYDMLKKWGITAYELEMKEYSLEELEPLPPPVDRFSRRMLRNRES